MSLFSLKQAKMWNYENDMVADACNSSTWEAEAWGLIPAQGQTEIHKTPFTIRKNKQKREWDMKFGIIKIFLNDLGLKRNLQ